MSDFISLHELKSFRALERLCSEMGWADLHRFSEPEIIAWLVARLKYVADTEETFPFGKWASIQHLQDLVDRAARKDTEE